MVPACPFIRTKDDLLDVSADLGEGVESAFALGTTRGGVPHHVFASVTQEIVAVGTVSFEKSSAQSSKMPMR